MWDQMSSFERKLVSVLLWLCGLLSLLLFILPAGPPHEASVKESASKLMQVNDLSEDDSSIMIRREKDEIAKLLDAADHLLQ